MRGFDLGRALMVAALAIGPASSAGAQAAAQDAADDRVYPVLEEPEHRPVFHNDRVDAYQVRMPVGRRSFYHRHTRDQLGITLSDASTANQVLGKPEAVGNSKRGSITYLPHSQTGGTTHRVRVVGGEMWVIGVEFVAPAPAGAKMAVAAPSDPALAFPQGRATRLRIAPGDSGRIAGELVVPMTSGTLRQVGGGPWVFEPGNLRWFDAAATLSNRGKAPVELVVIDLD